MKENENSIVWEMAIIILGLGLLIQIVLFFFARECFYVSCGLWLGIAIAIYMLVYMYYILKKGLGSDAKQAKKYVLVHFVVRYLSVGIMFWVVLYARLGSPFSCFAGVLCLKAAAYIQPFLEKRRIKKVKE